MKRKEKELEDSAKYGVVKDIMGGLFGGIMKEVEYRKRIFPAIIDTNIYSTQNSKILRI